MPPSHEQLFQHRLIPVVKLDQAAQAADLPILPGVVTPTELTCASRLGLDTLKFFPTGAMGGPATLKALAAPFPSLRLVPTGGVSASNIADELALDCVPACGGSWMVPTDAIAAGDFDHIASLTRETVNAVAKA